MESLRGKMDGDEAPSGQSVQVWRPLCDGQVLAHFESGMRAHHSMVTVIPWRHFLIAPGHCLDVFWPARDS